MLSETKEIQIERGMDGTNIQHKRRRNCTSRYMEENRNKMTSLLNIRERRNENMTVVFICGRTAVAQWLRYWTTNRKVAGSIPVGVIGIFH